MRDNQQLIEQIENGFSYPQPTATQANTFRTIQEQARALARTMFNDCPPGREVNLAVQHLEESIMWGYAAMARSGTNARSTGGSG